MVAHVERIDLQNLPSLVEPGKSWPKHGADFARPRLAVEMDRFVAGGDRRFHDVLSPAIPKTDRRRTDHAFTCKIRNKSCQRRSGRGNHKLAPKAPLHSSLGHRPMNSNRRINKR